MRAREKRQSALSQIHNRNEAEEGRRRIKLAECVQSAGKEDELEKHVMSYIYQSPKARLSCFPVKLVIITNEFAIVIQVTIFSCDSLVVITTEFAIIIEVARLS